MKRRYYSKEFKGKVIKLSYECSSIKELAKEMGLKPSLLYTWRSNSNIPASNYLNELKRLKQRLKKKEEEADILKKCRRFQIQTYKEIYQFIKDYRSIYPIERICQALGISSSNYHKSMKYGPTSKDMKEEKYTRLVKEIFAKSRGRYGSTRIVAQMKRQGFRVSKERVRRIMLANSLQSKLKTKYKVTTNSNHSHNISPNLLSQTFRTSRLNEVWVSDMTYLQTNQGWLYLTVIMDLYSRKIIGWSLSQQCTTKATIVPAWEMAIKDRIISAPLIFHSDRGIQYASSLFRKRLLSNTFISQSMSRRACCWDNAVAESFFKTLKSELIYGQGNLNKEHLTQEVIEFIDTWYNKERLHSSIAYKTPYEVELEFALA